MNRFLIAAMLVCSMAFSWAQEAPSEDSSKSETLEDKVKGKIRTDGLFRLYQDSATGSMQLFISKEQLNKDFIYQSFSMGGPPQFRLNQNMIRMTMVFQIDRQFDKLDFYQENTRFYFDPEKAVSKAANVDVSRAKFFSSKILFEDSTGMLIDADGLFLSTKLDPVKPNFANLPPGFKAYNFGNLNKEKSRYVKMRSFPENMDILVSLTFDDASPKAGAGVHITDPRYVEVKIQHSLLAMPENDYRPRKDDPRVGYFLDVVTDASSLKYPYYRDQIHRWHLVKKDPDAELSEPVKPITWWLENTTPVEYREIMLEAGRRWNLAFESAGFKNAVVMKQMPDTASWDPADIRYNVIRWVASDLGFAIGPSFVNPRTGEILGSDITIDLGMLKHSLNEAHSYEEGFQAIPHEGHSEGNIIGFCDMATGMKDQFGSAYAMALAAGADEFELEKLTEQYMVEIVLHEMGHTMGLGHNMKASQMLSLEEAHDTSITRTLGTTASVMDYTVVNVHSDPSKQGDYYTTVPGPYDHWAIEYGYRQFSPEEEEEGLKAVLAKSVDPRLDYGNDADISSAARGVDPRVQVWDMSSDMVEYSIDRFVGINNRMALLPEKFVNDSSSYQMLYFMYGYLNRGRSAMARSISRYIGGIYVNRNVPAHTDQNPYTPVPEDYQKRAMNVLATHVFGPDAYTADAHLYPYLQRQRRGWNFGYSEDPKHQNIVFGLQQDALNFLTHHNTLSRINNTSLYGNTYTVDEVLEDLSDACFEADLRSEVNLFRRNLQNALVDRLIMIYQNEKGLYDATSQAAAMEVLEDICEDLNRYKGRDDLTENHREFLVHKIESLWED